MKWAFLAATFAMIGPIAGWLRRRPHDAWMVWVVIGFLPFGQGPLHLFVAPVSWPEWPGYVKGAEVSLIDSLALAVLLSQPKARSSLPFRVTIAAYLLAVFMSVFRAGVPEAAAFYVWQLVRIFLLYAAVARAVAADERIVRSLLTGMTLGFLVPAVSAIFQRFGSDVLQAGGTFGHQNLLGLISHFVVFPTFALLLAGERGWQTVAGPVAGLTAAVMTASRATIGLAGIGLAMMFAMSALRGWTSRKSIVALVSLLAAAAAVPLALGALERRFEVAPLSDDYDERAAFEKAASMILSDHPMGVGANNYVVVVNTQGYSDRAGITHTMGSRSAHVHNAYYLVAAETGYLGLVTFAWLLVTPLIVAFRCGWRHRGDRRGDLLLGLGVALLVVYVHSFFEWIFVLFSVQYLLSMSLGMVAGVAQQLGYWERIPRPTLNRADATDRHLMPKSKLFVSPRN